MLIFSKYFWVLNNFFACLRCCRYQFVFCCQKIIMLQLGNDTERSNGSYFRRILHRALPSLGNRELRYSNLSVISDRPVHPLNRLPRRKKKRKRRKNRMPLNALSNPTTVVYCTCGGQTVPPSNMMMTKPCQSVPLRSLRICLSEVSERRRFLSEPRRTVKSVLRFVSRMSRVM